MPKPSPQADAQPWTHNSAFFERIGRRKLGDPSIEPHALRFTRDMVSDLRDYFGLVCTGQRCAESLRATSRTLTVFMGAKSLTYGCLEHDKEYNHWNVGWRWTVAASGTTVTSWCDDITESQEIACRLEIDVDDAMRMIYLPNNLMFEFEQDVVLAQRIPSEPEKLLGSINVSRAENGKIWLEIQGAALAVRTDGL